jgi:hypothetical protein
MNLNRTIIAATAIALGLFTGTARAEWVAIDSPQKALAMLQQSAQAGSYYDYSEANLQEIGQLFYQLHRLGIQVVFDKSQQCRDKHGWAGMNLQGRPQKILAICFSAITTRSRDDAGLLEVLRHEAWHIVQYFNGRKPLGIKVAPQVVATVNRLYDRAQALEYEAWTVQSIPNVTVNALRAIRK